MNLIQAPNEGLLERSLEKISVPSMVMWGEQDKVSICYKHNINMNI